MATQLHPDQKPSSSEFWYEDFEFATKLFLEVSGTGVMIFRCSRGADDKMQFDGVSLVTQDQIWFD